MTKDDDDTLCYRYELEAAVKAAVAAEREECAKVAENRMLLDASVKENVAHHTACKNIAADIRSRGKA
jgi:ferredoxin